MEQHPFDEAAGGRRGALSRRELLAATGGVVLAGSLAGNAASAFAASTATPKRGGTFRLGVTGGGAKDIIDGQSIVTKPDQARLTAGFETLADVRRQLPPHDERPGRRGDAGHLEAVDDPAQGGDRVPQRQDARRRRRHLLAEADPESRRRASSGRPASPRSTPRA